MNGDIDISHEQQAADAFSKQSQVFDAIYSGNKIVQYKRQRVRDHVQHYLPDNSYILELNAGTGEDSVYFAQQGHEVHATDISEGMLGKLNEKVKKYGLDSSIITEQCSFTTLANLKKKGPYDLVFSNFAGLNCTDRIAEVILSAEPLLAPKGLVTIVVLPPFSIWETFEALRGNFKLAFRRFGAKKGRVAHIDGQYFTCWYYKPSYIIKAMESKFDVLGVEGLCSIVPPSYFEHFADKHPNLYKFLQKAENRMKNKWPWRSIGDYYIITLMKK